MVTAKGEVGIGFVLGQISGTFTPEETQEQTASRNPMWCSVLYRRYNSSISI